jgi:hypothetical protein
MNWKTVGKVLFFIGLGMFVFNQVQLAVFSAYYDASYGPEEMAQIGYKIFDWSHNLRWSINDQVLGWPALMTIGSALWIGGRKAKTS